IAHHQSAARGLAVEPAQVIITSGRIESFHLIARMFLTYDARVVMEDPTCLGAYLSFKSAGARILSHPVDENGLITQRLPARGRGRVVVDIAPSHQYPTGAALSAARRSALIAWARRHGSLIVEDGFGDEFHDEGMQLQPIAQSAPDCTLYVGDFTASLGSGL